MRAPAPYLSAPARRPRGGRRTPTRRGAGPGRRQRLAVTASAAAVLVYVVVQVLRPAPDVVLSAATVPGVAGSVQLPWPSQGEAAVAVQGVGTVGTSGGDTPVPIASVTKVMTALLVLRAHPLALGQAGPTLTISAADVARYQQDVATQQSVLAVTAGEQLTELQALEGLLIPSANNLADVLAQWVAGSVAAFVAEMNAEARRLGLHRTRFVSPTGLDSRSVSTPTDLVRLAEAAMAYPVFASVVAMPQATLPVAGTVVNYDADVTHDGFVGIKTGSDGSAGGCFLFQADVHLDGQTVAVVGAVLGQQGVPILQHALDAATALVNALRAQLAVRTVVRRGQVVGRARSSWGAEVPLVAGRSVTEVSWPGMAVPGRVVLGTAGSTLRRGQVVGHLRLPALRGPGVPVVAGSALSGPSLAWRLTDW